MRILRTLMVLASLLVASLSQSQTTATIPRLVSFSGKASNVEGRAIEGSAGVTFAIYKEQTGGSPLWIETQTLTLDAKGNYTAQLGATKPAGLPLDLFTSGEARWLGVRVNGGEEQPRVLLLSVPYALKAADAETIGGLPPSAFVLAAPATSGSMAASASPSTAPVNPSVTGVGTTGSIPLWDSTSDITSSMLTQTGSGSTARLGVNITTPSATLDVKGTSNFRGTVTMPSAGLATTSAGKNSYPFVFATAAFNTGAKASVLQNFRWQAEPVGNNSASTTGKLNLLFSSGSSTPAETGLSIASNGQLSFATGQVFPGTGTITGVSAGKGLTGGGSAGSVTLNLDLTQVPLLASANTFTGNQTVSGNLSSTGVVSGSAFQIGSDRFGFGSLANRNAFLGFAGNPTLAGVFDTGVGEGALANIAAGDWNTAVGFDALSQNASGGNNTAVGAGALGDTTGSGNTAVGAYAGGGGNLFNTSLGYMAGANNTSAQNTTAIGAFAIVSESNALILGGTGQNSVSVGIGTATPYLDYGMTIDTTSGSGISGGIVVNATTGNLYLGMTKNVHKFRVDTNGVVWADGGFNASGADFAESVAVRGRRSEYEPGDVLEIDRAAHRGLTLSHHPYATLVAGIYSTKPGVLASPHTIDDTVAQASEVPLAIVGIVPCKVTAENGSIAPGDLLVTSSRAGYAMKGTDRRRMLGAVVGKALEPLAKGTGIIEVLVTLQ